MYVKFFNSVELWQHASIVSVSKSTKRPIYIVARNKRGRARHCAQLIAIILNTLLFARVYDRKKLLLKIFSIPASVANLMQFSCRDRLPTPKYKCTTWRDLAHFVVL